MKKSKFFLDPYSIALLGILVINALLKWRFFSGLVAADDFSYGVYSFTMFRIPMTWDMAMDFRVLRLSLLLPVTLLFRIVPPTVFTAVLYPMALSFGTIVLVYLIGRKLYGPNAGILAAFMMAFFPADVVYGTTLLPDIIVPFFLALSVWAFLNADTEGMKKAGAWFFGAGFALYLAFSARENSYYFLLFFVPFMFNKARWKKGMYYSAVGFLVPIMIVYTVYYFKSGDFLYNVHLAQYSRDPLIESGYIPKNATNWFMNMYFMLPYLFKKLTGNPVMISTLFGYTFYIGIPCLLYSGVKALKKRDPMMLLALWWFLIVFLYLEFGTISFSDYQMLKKLPRFLLTLTPAMALGFGVALSDAIGLGGTKIKKWKNINIRWLSAIPAVLVTGWLIFTSYGVMEYQKVSHDQNMRFFRWGYFEILKDKPNKPIYGTGGWWFNKLPFYYLPDISYANLPWRRSEILRDLKEVTDPSELSGSYVILDRRHFSGNNDLRIRHSYDDFGSFVKVPPRDWTLLGSSEGVEIYEVPENWTYNEPDGKLVVRDALRYATQSGEPMLFVNCLHPDFLSGLTRERLQLLANQLANPNDPAYVDLYENRMEFKMYNNIWKIQFNLE